MKFTANEINKTPAWSPPSRGAWIEIPLDTEDEYRPSVAPLAGGVD